MTDPSIGSSSPNWATLISIGVIPNFINVHELPTINVPVNTMHNIPVVMGSVNGEMSPYAPVFHPMGSHASHLLALEQAAQINLQFRPPAPPRPMDPHLVGYYERVPGAEQFVYNGPHPMQAHVYAGDFVHSNGSSVIVPCTPHSNLCPRGNYPEIPHRGLWSEVQHVTVPGSVPHLMPLQRPQMPPQVPLQVHQPPPDRDCWHDVEQQAFIVGQPSDAQPGLAFHELRPDIEHQPQPEPHQAVRKPRVCWREVEQQIAVTEHQPHVLSVPTGPEFWQNMDPQVVGVPTQAQPVDLCHWQQMEQAAVPEAPQTHLQTLPVPIEYWQDMERQSAVFEAQVQPLPSHEYWRQMDQMINTVEQSQAVRLPSDSWNGVELNNAASRQLAPLSATHSNWPHIEQDLPEVTTLPPAGRTEVLPQTHCSVVAQQNATPVPQLQRQALGQAVPVSCELYDSAATSQQQRRSVKKKSSHVTLLTSGELIQQASGAACATQLPAPPLEYPIAERCSGEDLETTAPQPNATSPLHCGLLPFNEWPELKKISAVVTPLTPNPPAQQIPLHNELRPEMEQTIAQVTLPTSGEFIRNIEQQVSGAAHAPQMSSPQVHPVQPILDRWTTEELQPSEPQPKVAVQPHINLLPSNEWPELKNTSAAVAPLPPNPQAQLVPLHNEWIPEMAQTIAQVTLPKSGEFIREIEQQTSDAALAPQMAAPHVHPVQPIPERWTREELQPSAPLTNFEVRVHSDWLPKNEWPELKKLAATAMSQPPAKPVPSHSKWRPKVEQTVTQLTLPTSGELIRDIDQQASGSALAPQMPDTQVHPVQPIPERWTIEELQPFAAQPHATVQLHSNSLPYSEWPELKKTAAAALLQPPAKSLPPHYKWRVKVEQAVSKVILPTSGEFIRDIEHQVSGASLSPQMPATQVHPVQPIPERCTKEELPNAAIPLQSDWLPKNEWPELKKTTAVAVSQPPVKLVPSHNKRMPKVESVVAQLALPTSGEFIRDIEQQISDAILAPHMPAPHVHPVQPIPERLIREELQPSAPLPNAAVPQNSDWLPKNEWPELKKTAAVAASQPPVKPIPSHNKRMPKVVPVVAQEALPTSGEFIRDIEQQVSGAALAPQMPATQVRPVQPIPERCTKEELQPSAPLPKAVVPVHSDWLPKSEWPKLKKTSAAVAPLTPNPPAQPVPSHNELMPEMEQTIAQVTLPTSGEFIRNIEHQVSGASLAPQMPATQVHPVQPIPERCTKEELPNAAIPLQSDWLPKNDWPELKKTAAVAVSQPPVKLVPSHYKRMPKVESLVAQVVLPTSGEFIRDIEQQITGAALAPQLPEPPQLHSAPPTSKNWSKVDLQPSAPQSNATVPLHGDWMPINEWPELNQRAAAVAPHPLAQPQQPHDEWVPEMDQTIAQVTLSTSKEFIQDIEKHISGNALPPPMPAPQVHPVPPTFEKWSKVDLQPSCLQSTAAVPLHGDWLPINEWPELNQRAAAVAPHPLAQPENPHDEWGPQMEKTIVEVPLPTAEDLMQDIEQQVSGATSQIPAAQVHLMQPTSERLTEVDPEPTTPKPIAIPLQRDWFPRNEWPEFNLPHPSAHPIPSHNEFWAGKEHLSNKVPLTTSAEFIQHIEPELPAPHVQPMSLVSETWTNVELQPSAPAAETMYCCWATANEESYVAVEQQPHFPLTDDIAPQSQMETARNWWGREHNEREVLAHKCAETEHQAQTEAPQREWWQADAFTPQQDQRPVQPKESLDWAPYSYGLLHMPATSEEAKADMTASVEDGTDEETIAGTIPTPINSADTPSTDMDFPSFEEFASQVSECSLSSSEYIATFINLLIRAHNLMLPLLCGIFATMSQVQIAAYTTAILEVMPLHPCLFLPATAPRPWEEINGVLPPCNPHSLTPHDLARMSVLVNGGSGLNPDLSMPRRQTTARLVDASTQTDYLCWCMHMSMYPPPPLHIPPTNYRTQGTPTHFATQNGSRPIPPGSTVPMIFEARHMVPQPHQFSRPHDSSYGHRYSTSSRLASAGNWRSRHIGGLSGAPIQATCHQSEANKSVQHGTPQPHHKSQQHAPKEEPALCKFTVLQLQQKLKKMQQQIQQEQIQQHMQQQEQMQQQAQMQQKQQMQQQEQIQMQPQQQMHQQQQHHQKQMQQQHLQRGSFADSESNYPMPASEIMQQQYVHQLHQHGKSTLFGGRSTSLSPRSSSQSSLINSNNSDDRHKIGNAATYREHINIDEYHEINQNQVVNDPPPQLPQDNNIDERPSSTTGADRPVHRIFLQPTGPMMPSMPMMHYRSHSTRQGNVPLMIFNMNSDDNPNTNYAQLLPNINMNMTMFSHLVNNPHNNPNSNPNANPHSNHSDPNPIHNGDAMSTNITDNATPQMMPDMGTNSDMGLTSSNNTLEGIDLNERFLEYATEDINPMQHPEVCMTNDNHENITGTNSNAAYADAKYCNESNNNYDPTNN